LIGTGVRALKEGTKTPCRSPDESGWSNGV